MDNFPERELAVFFGSQSLISDHPVPLYYNGAIYEYAAPEETIRFEIEPAFDEIRITWSEGSLIRLNMHLIDVRNLEVSLARGAELLMASGGNDEQVFLLKLRLRPRISVELNYERVQN